MRGYALGLIALTLAAVAAVTLAAVGSIARLTAPADAARAATHLQEARTAVRNAHAAEAVADARPLLEEASQQLDAAGGLLAGAEVVQAAVGRTVLVTVCAAALFAILAGALLWFGSFRWLVTPLSRLAGHMQRLTDHPSPIDVPTRGPREIRALQHSFNRLVIALNDYRDRITNMERVNIGRYLTHQFRNSLTPIRLGADQLAEAGPAPDLRSISAMLREETARMEAILDRFVTLAPPTDWPAALTADVDVVLLDLYLGSVKGRNVLERLLAEHPLVPVIIVSGVATAEEAVDCVRCGAFDYLEKPLTAERLAITVGNAARYRQVRLAALADTVPVFASQSMRALADDCRKVAATDAAVLITGESGTGKEVTARYIHGLSRRSDRALVKVDCGALPESLIESELFGHARGAFTGAHADYPGKLPAAAGGTVFLDEVAELPPGAQTRLLRFLDSGEVQRIGSTAVATVDARIIAATNADLERAVGDGTLRRDLYFRLNVIRLRIPPLRSRREDIAPLAESFVTSLAARLGVEPRMLSPDAHRRLSGLSLPGNVRELKTIIERVLVLGDAHVIDAADIERAAAGGVAEAGDPFAQTMPLAEAKRQLERRYLHRQLDLHGQSVKRTAAALGILPNNLSRRVRQLESGDIQHADSE